MSPAASKPAARSRRATAAFEARQRRDSDIQELTVPPGERPSRNNLPGSIEEAVLALLDQVPRSASIPAPPRDDAAEAGADVDLDDP